MNLPSKIWQNGNLIEWTEAKVHVMAHGLHYGSTVFEGIRAYGTDRGSAIFRLDEHLQRLFDSCKMYRIPVPYSQAEIKTACCQVVLENQFSDAYVRPIVYRDLGGMGLATDDDHPVGVAVGAFEWGPLLGKEALEKGTDICVSSWTRLQSSTNPVMAKAGGHYLTSQLISTEAKLNGYAEGIAVNQHGVVTEGAGSNLFLVKQGKIYTPPLGVSILEGITRDTLMKIAKADGLEVIETNLVRESLYAADELFLCGTAAELTPVVSVDRITINDGKPGPISRQLQTKYKQLVTGQCEDTLGWLTHVSEQCPSDTQPSGVSA